MGPDHDAMAYPDEVIAASPGWPNSAPRSHGRHHAAAFDALPGRSDSPA